MLELVLDGLHSRQHQTGSHPRPGFVPAYGTRTHLHPSADLFGAINCPGYFGLTLKSAVALPVKLIKRTIIFGAYDNIIARFGILGRFLRDILQALERTPLNIFGLSHFWVVEKLKVHL